MAYAGARVLRQRYVNGAGGAQPVACVGEALARAGLNPDDTGVQGDGPANVGSRAGQAALDAGANDGSNEAKNYADTTGWTPVNEPLVPSSPGTTMKAPDHWQQLNLQTSVSQNGIVVDGLQWATYQDAADQAGQSRIWGGIHLEPDDFAGRRVGHEVGAAAVALARRFYSGAGR